MNCNLNLCLSKNNPFILIINEDGSLNKVEALRFRDVADDDPTLWQVEILEDKKMEGLNIPSKMAVTWLLDEGPFTWYKFEITDLKYNE